VDYASDALMRAQLFLRFASLLCLPLFAQSAFGQLSDTGLDQFGTFQRNHAQTMNLFNLDNYLEFPLFAKKERGVNFNAKLVWDQSDSLQFFQSPYPPGGQYFQVSGGPGLITVTDVYYNSHLVGGQSCSPNTSAVTTYFDSIVDQNNTVHPIPTGASVTTGQYCGSGTWHTATQDGKWLLTVTWTDQNCWGEGCITSVTETDPSGNVYGGPSGSTTALTDPNGNQITKSTPTPGNSTWTDPTGNTIFTAQQPSPPPYTFSYPIQTGGMANVQLNFTSGFTLQNNFGCLPYTNTSATLPTSISLPDGTSYGFVYESSNGTYPSSTVTGRIHSITLPAGGTNTYTYSGGTNGITCPDGKPAILTITGSDGSVWTYNRTVSSCIFNCTTPHVTTVVTDPGCNDTVYGFESTGLQLQVQSYQGTAGTAACSPTTKTLLRTITTCYDGNFTNCGITSGSGSCTGGQLVCRADKYTYLPGLSQPSLSETFYNSAELVTQQNEFDYGVNTGSAPTTTPLRATMTAYANIGNHILKRPACVQVTAGTSPSNCGTVTGTTNSLTNYLNYDSHGNVGTLQRWVSGTTYISRSLTYFSTGLVNTENDFRGTPTTYTYGACNSSYPTQITTAGISQSFTWDCNGGVTTSSKDANSQTTSYTYTNPANGIADPFWRLTQTIYPDGGKFTTTYNDTASPVNIGTNKLIDNAGHSLTTQTNFDGFGRVTQTQLTSDPQGTVFTDTTYDLLGRIATVSNPYRAGTDITTSTGITTYAYDALSRKVSETYTDLHNAVLTTAYCGASTLVTDPTGRWRRSRADALGRLVEVDEPNAIGATVASTGCPGTGEPIWVSSYTYDGLNNLTQVVQNGSHQRGFTYDSLSRLLTSSNPETGTITYKYDSDTNCASPNSFPGLLISKTDARGIRTCYQYDALNRETVRNYSNSDPTVTTTYDQTNCLGLPSCANIGHRTSMTDAAGSESWSYDVVDRIHKDQRTTNSITKSATYNLDYAGNVTSAVYPTGRTVNYTYDAANRPSTSADGSNGITYATGFKTSPGGTCLNNVTCYTPQGTFYALSIGQSPSLANGLNLTHTYNSRLQPERFNASTGTTANVGGTATWTRGCRLTICTAINFITSSPANVYAGQSITASGWTPSFINGNYVVNSITDPTHFSVQLSDNINHGSGTNASGNLTFVPNAVDITYSFQDHGVSSNSGHVNWIFNNLDPTRTQLFTYDQLNRITTATGTTYASSPAHCWGETYNVDAWGNLQSIAATTDPNYTGCTQESGFSRTADGNNHLSGLSYDLSGNTQSDGINSYTWNAESQLTSSGGVNYLYDGDGRRVSKSSGKLYWYGAGGDILAETDASGNTTAEYIFFGGKRIAMLPTGGTPIYYVEDMLGTSRVTATNTGVVCYDADFYPYGGERPYTNSCPQNYKFEGKERDTETGNDDFGARYYSNRFGRWLSADWSSVPVPVPYANLTNPQTLNLYGMVADDPESFADLDGHFAGEGPCIFVEGGCSITALQNGQSANESGLDPSSWVPHGLCNDKGNCYIAGNPQQQNQGASIPAPTNPDGSPQPPSEPPPPGKGPDGKLVPNEWVPGKGTPDRDIRWDPKYPIPGQSQPNASWDDKQGHWDYNDGLGNRTRRLPDGTKVDHFNNPIPRSTTLWDRIVNFDRKLAGKFEAFTKAHPTWTWMVPL
jgi:RHS repeat-associated protein